MSSVLTLLSTLRELNVRLELDGGKLKINAPKGALNDELKAALIENKEDIISFLTRAQASEETKLVLAPADERVDKIPATDSQARFWFLDKLFPGDSSLNIPAILELRGEINIELFELSVKALLQRHDSLRLGFIEREGQPYLQIPEQTDWSLKHLEKDITSADDLQSYLVELAGSVLDINFDLSQGPLIDLQLFRLNKSYSDTDVRDHHVLMCCVHHIVCDAWSIELILKELATIYISMLQGNVRALPRLEYNYSDYAYWQSLPEQKSKNSEHLDYWKSTLAGAKGLLSFPYDRVRPLKPASAGGSLDFSFDSVASSEINTFCRSLGLTPFMFFVGAYHICLAQYAKTEDICTGVPIAGRTRQEFESVVGLFLNALIIRTTPELDRPISAYFSQLKQDVLEAFDHQEVGIDTLIDHLDIDREFDEVPGVQFGFNFQNAQNQETLSGSELGGFESDALSLRPLSLGSKSAKHDLSLTLGELNKKFHGAVEYRSSLLDEKSINEFVEHFKSVCQQLISLEREAPLRQVKLFSQKDLAAVMGLRSEFEKGEIEALRPMTASQEGFYLNDLIRADNQSTLIGTSILVKGDFDLARWQGALQGLSDQRSVLRMQLFPCDHNLLDPAYQVIFKHSPIDFEIVDAQSWPLEKAQQEAKDLIYRPFDLHRSPLIRYRAYCLSEDRYLLVTSMHHTLMDAVSALQHWIEAQSIYENRPILEDSYLGYLDFSEKQIDSASVLSHWETELSCVEAADYTVYGNKASDSFHPQGKRQLKRLMVEAEEWGEVKAFCRKQGITPAILYKVLFGYLAKVWCQCEDDFYVNEIITGRDKAHAKTLGNCFLIQPFIFNTENFVGESSVVRSLSAAKQQQKKNRNVALLSQQAFNKLKESGRISFYYNFLTFMPPEDFLGNEVEFRDWGNEIDDALEFNPRVGPSGLELNLFYRENLFREEGFLQSLQLLVRQLMLVSSGVQNLGGPDFERPDFDYLGFEHLDLVPNVETAAEKAACLYRPPNTEQQALENKSYTVVDLFLNAVEENGAAPALLGERHLSYADLASESAKVANFLHAQGVKEKDLVVVELAKSTNLIASIVGILRLGAQYLPIDLALPEERRAYIKENAHCSFVINDTCIEQVKDYPGTFDVLEISLDNPAYTIYTSGSTGMPKGVQVGHGALVRTYLAWKESFELNSTDRHLQMASVGFDVFTGDWVRALCSGASLYLVDKDTLLEPEKLLSVIETQKISIAEFVPAVLRNLSLLCEQECKKLSLRMLMVGSDAWFESDQKRLECVTEETCLLVNSYGVTEASIDSSYALIERSSVGGSASSSVSIGEPFSNTGLYVLDNWQNLLPREVPGELYIAGDELADNYVDDEVKTQASFFKDTVLRKSIPKARMYRTGDKAVVCENGDLLLLGRIGQQIKIRGFRVELGEIENQLCALQEVRESIVLAQTSAQAQASVQTQTTAQTPEATEANRPEQVLVAYVVFNGGHTLSSSEIRRLLAAYLPDYMVPNFVIALDEIPLNANGKLDRKALPPIDFSNIDSREFVKPRNELEQSLLALWQQVLGIENISVNDSFFELGGHSLLATQLLSRIKTQFSRSLPLKVVFEKPTIAEQADSLDALLRKADYLSAPDIVAVEREALMPVSYAQQRFWFLDKLVPGFFAYNMPFGLKVKGEFQVEAFHKALSELLNRHELLRCNFVSQDDKVYARVNDCDAFPLQQFDLSQIENPEKDQQIKHHVDESAHKAFVLDSDLLMRCRLVKLDSEQTLVLGCIHHIVSDGWSVRAMIQELAFLYNAFSQRRPSPLPMPKLQYLDYAAWEQSWLQGDVLEAYTEFWLKELEGAPEILRLPTDKPRPAAQTFNGKQISKTLPSSFQKDLNRFSQQQNVSIFMSLMAAMAVLMSRYTKEKDILIGTPVAGRNDMATENIIGLFLNAVIIRSRLHDNPSVAGFLSSVKDACLGAFAHQDMPTEILYERVANHRDPQFPPGAQVGLVLQNTASQATSLDAKNFGDHLQGLSAELMGTEQVISNYDFGFTIVELDEGLQVIAEFNTDLFFDSTIEKMLNQYICILESMMAAPDQGVNTISLVAEENLLRELGADENLYQDALPLSSMQNAMYLANSLNPNSKEYGVGFSVRIRQPLDVALWTESLQGLIDTQTLTRIVFQENSVPYLDDVYQLVLKERKAKVELHDWRELNKSEEEIEALASQFINAPYRVSKDELMRVMLIQVADDYFVGVFAAHHILMDGIAVVAFGVMGAMNYEIVHNGGQAIVHEDKYKEYLYQNQSEIDNWEVTQFWREKLLDSERRLEALEYPVKTDVLFDRVKPPEKHKQSLTLDPQHWGSIQIFCKQNRINPALYFKALYGIVLAKYCRAEEDFYIFEILAGRPTGHMNALGCYFQQIPNVFQKDYLNVNSEIGDLFKFLRQQQKQAKNKHQISVPFQTELLPDAPVSFMYNFEHYIPDFHFMGQAVEIQEYSNQVNGIVQLLVKTLADSAQLNLQSQRGFFQDHNLLQRIEALSLNILSGQTCIGALPLLTPAESNQQINQWNETLTENVSALPVHKMIEEAAKKFPDHCATKDARGSLSYEALHEQANQLAHYLLQQGVGKGDVVGVCLPLCKEVPLAILAVLKTGAAYLPMDSRYPDERLQYFVEDCKVKTVLTLPSELERLANVAPSSFVYSIFSDTHLSFEKSPPEISCDGDDLIYALYTSGSTGKPNCTASFHRSEVNLIDWYCGEFAMDEEDKVLVISALGFDLTQKNLIAPLTCGASIFLHDSEHYDDQAIRQVVSDERITWLNCAPSAFYPMCVNEEFFPSLSSLRWVFLGGEAINYELLHKWYQQCESKLVNSYGPSECTDISSYYVVGKNVFEKHVVQTDAVEKDVAGKGVEGDEKIYDTVPLGKANKNVLLYVLNHEKNLLPAGIPGELYVGGYGVGAGYIHNEDLSAAKFFDNPFAEGKIYRTGDLVRYLEDGNLEYIGRSDFQIKRRGVRIEPSEIESRVKQQSGVKECVLVLDDEQQLIAYVLAPEFSEDAALLRESIETDLRRYFSPSMLPDYIELLEAFPLSPNGKIDRKALPKPDRNEASYEYVAPIGDLEVQLAEIWKRVLGNARIGRYDNFFEVGGHSLLAVQLLSAVNKEFELDLPLAVLFEAQSLDALAIKISSASENDWQHLVQLKSSIKAQAQMVCIHPVGGEVLCYRDFARALPESVDVFALQAQGLLKNQEPIVDSVTFVNLYTDIIEKELSSTLEQSPLYIAGQSIGGVFALALAKELERRGRATKGVILFDSFVPNESNLQMIGVEHIRSALGAFMQVDEDSLQSLSELDQLRLIFEQAKANYLIPQEIEFEQISARYVLAKANIELAKNISVENKSKMSVLHVQAETSLSGKLSREGWGEYFYQVQYETCSGNHESIMNGANARALAKYFESFSKMAKD